MFNYVLFNLYILVLCLINFFFMVVGLAGNNYIDKKSLVTKIEDEEDKITQTL